MTTRGYIYFVAMIAVRWNVKGAADEVLAQGLGMGNSME